MNLNLTYRLKDNGYVIVNNGNDWYVQDMFIPFPRPTMEESAQAHINDILAKEEESRQNIISVHELNARLEEQQGTIVGQQEVIDELVLMIAELLMV